MQEVPGSVLTAWSSFYVITGSAAAALTGLMFVVTTLVADDRRRAKVEGIAVFSTPTVIHFGAALLVSAILSAPWHSLAPVAVLVGLTGLYGTVAALRVMHRTSRLTVYRPLFEDWLWYTVLPLAAYLAIAGAATRLAVAPTVPLYAIAAGTILLIFIGIHNAWDVVTYLAVEGVPEQSGEGTPPPRSERDAEAAPSDKARAAE